MKKIFAFAFILASALLVVNATPRTALQARSVAEKALLEKTGKIAVLHEIELNTSAPAAAPLSRALSGITTSTSDITPFYVFNGDDNQSFVIISGSDLMPEVIGYGLQGTLSEDMNEWPTNMISWLQYVADVQSTLESDETGSVQLERSACTSVQPVAPLVDVHWGQDAPFNQDCPQVSGKTVPTGCMATSIAQIFRYNRFPTKPTGSYSYEYEGVKRSIDFSGVTYNYDLMPGTYTSSATSAQKAEVAKLMKGIGYSIGMQYAADGSGAIELMCSRAFIQNFGYTKAATLMREYFSLDEWNQIMQRELQSARAMVFNGQSSGGGHSFVVDGIDAASLYHVNWGWNGSYDGYFDVSIMNPTGKGTGGGTGSDGYSLQQTIIVNMAKPTDDMPYYTELFGYTMDYLAVDTMATTVGEVVTFTGNLTNFRTGAFNGKFGIVVENEDGSVYQEAITTPLSVGATTYSYHEYEQGWGLGWTAQGAEFAFPYTLPASMPNGKYRAYICVKPNDSANYDKIRVAHKNNSYRAFTVSNGNVTFDDPENKPDLSIVSWISGNEVLYGNNDIKVSIKNNGTETYSMPFTLKFTSPTNTSSYASCASTTIMPGETKVIQISKNFNKLGEWAAQLVYTIPAVDPDTEYELGSTTFTAVEAATAGMNFTNVQQLSVLSEELHNNSEASFKVVLDNTGEAYDGVMTIRIYKLKIITSSTKTLAEINQRVQVAANSTNQEIVISGLLSLADGLSYNDNNDITLYAKAYYTKGSSLTALTSSALAVTVNRIPTTAIDEIAVEPVAPEGIFNILGHPVDRNSQLPNGIYISGGKKFIIRK